MRKKMLSLIVSVSTAMSFVPAFAAHAETGIQIGDYVQMGTYYDKPILWRCVDIDENNGPLMLSDKVLCMKPYDAKGSVTTGSHIEGGKGNRDWYGSNYWEDSNIRSWLNSDAEAGKVEWLCGNPPTKENVSYGYNAYDQEAGFLTNFKPYEKVAIKEVTQKVLLGLLDYRPHDSGSEIYSFKNPSDIEDVMANYDKAYSNQVADKMFLLEVNQLYALYKNSDVLGEDYQKAKTTQECMDHNEYKSGITIRDFWPYWLRTPYYNPGGTNTTDKVCQIDQSGKIKIGASPLSGGVGIRPAFYLAESAEFNGDGTGEVDTPYTIKDVPVPVEPTAVAERVGDDFASETEADYEASVWKLTVTPGEGNSYSSIAARVSTSDGQSKDSNSLNTALTGSGSIVFALVIGRNADEVKSIDAVLDGKKVVNAYNVE